MTAPIDEKESVIELKVSPGEPEIRVAPEPPELPSFGEEFKTLEFIGRDSMGELYRLRNEKIGRDFFARVVTPDLLPDTEAKKTFQRLCKRYLTINHSCLLPIFSLHEDDRGVWFTSAAPDATASLQSYFDDGEFKSSVKVSQIFEQLHDSMKVLNQVGIRFGAIPPSGILIEETSDGPVVHLRDWWAFALLQAQGGKPHAATLPYSSPEQLMGDDKLDERSDIYTFGALLFAALTGRPPFTGADPVNLAVKIVKSDPPAVDGPFEKSPFAQLAANCMKKEPEQRYESLDELMTDFRTATRGAALKVSGKKTPNSWTQPQTIVAIILSLLFAAFFFDMQFSDPETPLPEDVVMANAFEAETRGDWRAAERYWDRYTQMLPADQYGWDNLGRAQARAGHTDAARQPTCGTTTPSVKVLPQ
jgi:serine/threonine protein kinase